VNIPNGGCGDDGDGGFGGMVHRKDGMSHREDAKSTKKSENETLDAFFRRCDVEVDQQSDWDARSFPIRQPPRLVNSDDTIGEIVTLPLRALRALRALRGDGLSASSQRGIKDA
jgi:hypothetical protein